MALVVFSGGAVVAEYTTCEATRDYEGLLFFLRAHSYLCSFSSFSFSRHREVIAFRDANVVYILEHE